MGSAITKSHYVILRTETLVSGYNLADTLIIIHDVSIAKDVN